MNSATLESPLMDAALITKMTALRESLRERKERAQTLWNTHFSLLGGSLSGKTVGTFTTKLRTRTQ